MYRLESFGDDGAVVTNDAFPYRAIFRADDVAEAEKIVIGLNAQVMLRDLADLRFSFEVQGLALPNGLLVLTDRESQGQLFNSFGQLKYGLIPDTDWKAATGWQTARLEELTPIAQGVAAHVRGCFRAERLVTEAISEATSVEHMEAINVPEMFRQAYQSAYAEIMDVTA